MLYYGMIKKNHKGIYYIDIYYNDKYILTINKVKRSDLILELNILTIDRLKVKYEMEVL